MSLNKWTLKRFLEKAKEIHGYKYDYSNIKEYDINSYNDIIINCKKCNNNWITCISNHITKQNGCPKCAVNFWSIERFLKEAKEFHGDKYDYSNIKECDIQTGDSKIDITCNKCKNRWCTTSVRGHITNQNGCPKCRKSKLEQKLYNVFNQLDINYYSEYIPSDFKLINCKFRYDAYFEHNNKTYFVEMDGLQHFKNVDFFKDNLEYVQLKDRIKAQFVIKHPNNYNLIRIDYTCKTQDDLKKFILKSIKSKNKINLYNPEIYKDWINKEITEEEYEKINNGAQYYLLLTIMDVINEMKSSR